jgi:hypothetical protein
VQPPTEQRIVQERLPRIAGECGAVGEGPGVALVVTVGGETGHPQPVTRTRVGPAEGDCLGRVEQQDVGELRFGGFRELHTDRADEGQRREPLRGPGRHLERDPTAEAGPHQVDGARIPDRADPLQVVMGQVGHGIPLLGLIVQVGAEPGMPRDVQIDPAGQWREGADRPRDDVGVVEEHHIRRRPVSRGHRAPPPPGP